MISPTGADRAEIDEALIEKLVRRFYDRVRGDAELGPIFAAVIGDDWEPHLQKMFAFWSSLMLMSGRYKGRPMQAHIRLKGVQPAHFDIWLRLFKQTSDEVCSPEMSALFVDKASRIAQNFSIGMFTPGRINI